MVLLMLKVLFSIFATGLAVGNQHKENSESHDPPCFFNPLCKCSKAYPDLGRVTCKNIPLLTIPQQINMSKVFTLHLENNGLRYVEPHFFRKTGLFRIEISRNHLTEIDGQTFTGLERSLWELNLQHNRFRRVPSQSFRYLQKLKVLDLSDNEIISIRHEDWLGLENSLKNLILSGNKLSSINPRAFSILEQLESLDLRRNALFEFDPFAFKDVTPLLKELLLADNLIMSIPLQELSELRSLRYLDLSFNQITEIGLDFDSKKKKPAHLNLDTLRLDFNQIRYVPFRLFKSFPTLNRTYFNGNPITHIEVEKDAFQGSKIQELHFKDCEISDLSVDAFSGLKDHLEVLDLEGNNLTSLPLYFFKDFYSLKSLNLKDNFFEEIDFQNMFDGIQSSLQHLDLSGLRNSAFSFNNLEKLHSLRSLVASKFPDATLSPNSFPEFLLGLEEMKISHSNIKTLGSHSFKHVRGLKRLDLSENSIARIDNEAFAEVGHSLVYLSLANGMSSDYAQLPSNIFEHLTSIEFLDLSNNRLKVLPQKLFYSMKRLKVVQIQDNFIEFIPKTIFQEDIHSELTTILLSFNQLSSIESQRFVGLNKLESLWLNDNRIVTIGKKSFENLGKLRYLYLRGNNINSLKEESFQNLPELEKLDLSYNKLKTFNYDCLEQVGTLSSFTLNISHNYIEKLASNLSVTDYPTFAVMQVNIKALDLSHNNISFIGPGFFKPIESSATHLYLSHNKLSNSTRGAFANMMHLQWLDLSFNFIPDFEYNAFANTKSIQVLNLSHNRLVEIPRQLFKGLHRLRILNLENNDLRSLPNNIFNDALIEKLDLSNNRLVKVPFDCFSPDSAATLSELDLSQNGITALPSSDRFFNFKNLYWLNLSKNRIIRLEDGVFSYLGRLHVLDLSDNAELTLDSKGQTFYGLDDTLEVLVLKNLSLNTIPTLKLYSLRSLDVSDNQISDIPFDFAFNISHLQRIELTGNKLVTIPPAISALTRLQYLGVSRNKLESVSFQQSFTLREVDLQNISLRTLEKGTLGKLPLLENIKLSINQETQNVNLPYLLKDNYGLKNVYVEVLESEGSLMDAMNGLFPPKLQNLALVGRGLRTVPRNLLQGIQSSRLDLILFNTSVEVIPDEVFDNARKIRNLTLHLKSNKLKTVYNPNTGDSPNVPKKTFLLDLQISDNNWICDCSIGWIEGWERKRRHYFCGEDSEDCFLASDDLRSAVCSNLKQNTIIEAFKTELECGWNSTKNLRASVLMEFMAAVAVLWLTIA